MILVLAHHLEAHHLPVLAAMFGVGFLIGWQNVERFMNRKQPESRNANQL